MAPSSHTIPPPQGQLDAALNAIADGTVVRAPEAPP